MLTSQHRYQNWKRLQSLLDAMSKQLFYTQIWYSRILFGIFLNLNVAPRKSELVLILINFYTAGLACLCDMKLHSEFKYVLYINAVTALPPGCFHLGVYLNCLVSRQPSQEPARQTTVDYLKVAWRRVYRTIILPSFPYVHTSMRT